MASRNLLTVVGIEIECWEIVKNNYLTELRSFVGANSSVGANLSEKNVTRNSSGNELRSYVHTGHNNVNRRRRSAD